MLVLLLQLRQAAISYSSECSQLIIVILVLDNLVPKVHSIPARLETGGFCKSEGLIVIQKSGHAGPANQPSNVSAHSELLYKGSRDLHADRHDISYVEVGCRKVQ